MASERDENVPDDDAGFVRGAFGLDFEHDGGGLFGALERVAKSVWQTNWLQADAEITLRDVTFFQQGVNDAIDGGRGNGDSTEAGEARGGDADDAALGVNYGAADRRGLQTDVEANVRREGGAGPGAALRGDQANYAQRGDGAAGSGAADDKGQAARLQCGRV